jgi:4-hydroxybenzoate polyprenyltransferase
MAEMLSFPQRAPVRWANPLMGLVVSMRPKQWIKNGLVFLPLIFSVNLYWTPRAPGALRSHVAPTVLAFLLFCATASATYLINDRLDLEKDRQHPKKRLRPLAAGLLPPWVAVVTALLLLAGALPAAIRLRPAFGGVLLLYATITLLYSLYLKHVVLLDVFTLASGFLLRTVAGAVVVGIPISPWLYVCATLGALFLGFGKRRQELLLLRDDAGHHRAILRQYSPALIDHLLAVITSSLVMAYALYTFTAENLPRGHQMMWTIPFVLYGVFRYLYLVHVRGQGGSPEEVLYRDRPLALAVVAWLATVVVVLAVFRS